MPTIAMYPGSFDPVTNGHLDIIKRSSRMFDKVIVAVLVNSAKTPLFTVEERVAMLREACKNIPNVEIDSFNGLTVSFAKQKAPPSWCAACAPSQTLRMRSSLPTPTTP